ncbi:MAG: hypothetical protein GYB33_01610 [Gammaproteobacteria bacterium]|uniref:hypothetical protein n=1 Tax=Pseudomaricurvus alcaniphilus TaxID=1166482 RepID=UPI00140E9372|nr:hypothetical protein [Pseudomaricurvus alcaniphilus]MBR9909031.1 hypothetical protein [Gammaproteobacteria bacterium]NHN38083.1 hypothetical protein [Pseudomaricurvus alcaniphilus]
MKKSLIIAGVFSALLTTGLVYAEQGEKGERGDCDRGKRGGHHMMQGGHHFKKDRGEMMEREFNADQIRTLAEAKLIMHGNENLMVGQVLATDTGYSVTILTRDGSLVEEKALAKNGMPLDKYQHILERMEKRQSKQNAQ